MNVNDSKFFYNTDLTFIEFITAIDCPAHTYNIFDLIIREIICTIRPKSPPDAVILTDVLCTIELEFLITDDMIPYLPST